MNVTEFLGNRDPGDESAFADSVTSPTASNDETKEDEFEHVTSLTPAGIEVLYSWSPKRLYRLRLASDTVNETLAALEWTEVPSVTSVLGILDKSGALTWWGMKVGVEGVNKLICDVKLGYDASTGTLWNIEEDLQINDAGDVVDLLTKNRLTVNHVKDKAADRGINVHSALEGWAVDQSFRANPELYEEHERGYIVGLNKFLDDIEYVADVEAEVMVGSLTHGFAGRYDLRLTTNVAHSLVTKVYPKRGDKVEEVPAGKYLLDLKTSKGVYNTHALQLAAYELASVECGYGSTDYRAVIHVTEDGRYEFVRTHARPEDFLSILQAHTTMQGAKSWL